MNDMTSQCHFNEPAASDADPAETQEWRDALLSLAATQGLTVRARFWMNSRAWRAANASAGSPT